MGTGFQSGITGLTDSLGSPAVAVVSTNVRVKTATGYVGTLADIVQFAGVSIVGNWVMPAMRCQIMSVPAINASSAGIAYMPSITGLSPTGPMMINAPDPRASGT